MKIAFLDHEFHRFTKSLDFLWKMLNESGHQVDVFYVGANSLDTIKEIAKFRYDEIILAQTEFCAPFFLLKGFRVVCIPMFDGVECVPDYYWKLMSEAIFISFSKKLHDRLISLGLESYYFQYFDERQIEVPQAKFDVPRIFFSERQPYLGLDFKFLLSLFGNIGLSCITLHISKEISDSEKVPDCVNKILWQDNKEEYLAHLSSCNIYVAPRLSEGMGANLQDAMARGMYIIANDNSTMNEYITNNVNGKIVNYLDVVHRSNYLSDYKVDVSQLNHLENLGRQVRKDFRMGVSSWLRNKKLLLLIIESCPPPFYKKYDAKLADGYIAVAYRFLVDYHNVIERLSVFQFQIPHLKKEHSSLGLKSYIKYRYPIARRVYRKLKQWLT